MKDKIQQAFKKDITFFFMANVLFSISTMIINMLLPKIMEKDVFENFIYIFQMVLFLTSVFQIGLVVGLYHFIEKDRKEILNIYYLCVGTLIGILVSVAIWPSNPILKALNLDGISYMEQIAFFLSVAASEIFLYNKGKNVADKDYHYMMRIAVTSFTLRMIALACIGLLHITNICLILVLIFIIPFIQDLCDFRKNCIRYLSFTKIQLKLLQRFLYYCAKIWVIAALFTISDRLFLISTKGLDISFTTALAFSSGFVGIISLFNSCFTNYFMSNLSTSRMDEIAQHISRLTRLVPIYAIALLAICFAIAFGIHLIYPSLGSIAPTVAFIILLRTGIISYLGMYSLLTKVMNMLNIEIALNVCRVLWTAALCFLWKSGSIMLWFTTVTFMILIPEIIMTILTKHRVKALTSSSK